MDIGRKIAVIGAGLCGLKCAHDLGSRGASVTVFEKSRGIGGRLANRRARTDLRPVQGGVEFFCTDRVWGGGVIYHPYQIFLLSAR